MKFKLNIWLTLCLFAINAVFITIVFALVYTNLEEALINRTIEQLKSVNILKKIVLDQILMDRQQEAGHNIRFYYSHVTDEQELIERLSAITDLQSIDVYPDTMFTDPLFFGEGGFNALTDPVASQYEFYFKLPPDKVIKLSFGFQSIQEILRERTGLGITGESYMVGENRQLITESIFYSDQQTDSIEAETVGVINALNGIEGSGTYEDYRGVLVMGSYRPVSFHGMKLALLTEIDQEEAMAPILEIRNNLLYLLIFLMVLSLIISAVLAQVLANPILRLKKVADLLSLGALPTHIKTTGPVVELDEITKSMNQLIGSLKQTVIFAEEIGKGKMDGAYKLLSKNDELGRAILQMREQLVKLDQEKNMLELNSKRILIETQEKERERIARDLHDGLGTLLTAMKMKMENSGIFAEKGEDFKGLLEKTITETRSLARNLMPSVLMDFGLNEALTQLVRDLSATTSIKIHFVNELESSKTTLDKTQRVSIYRIVQEALNNAFKHSGCTEIQLSITDFDDFIILFVKDNGQGFDTGKDSGSRGLGLRNMEERARTMNGKLYVESGNEGTIIEVEIPLI